MVTWVDAVKYAQHVQNLGITETPGVLIAGNDNKKYLFEGKLSDGDAVNTFFDAYSKGELQAHLKSEPVPETQDEDVYVLVGSEFEKVVGQEQDVFVEFYAPWCGHCKKLAPEYEAAAVELKGKDPAVRLAKVDCIANAAVCQKFNVTGYPTLKYF